MGMHSNVGAGWNRTWSKGAGRGGGPPAPASYSPSGKQWRQKVSMSLTVASTSCLPSPFLPCPLHLQSHEGLANTFNVFCPLLKEGTGRAKAALHPQLLRTLWWSNQQTTVSFKGNPGKKGEQKASERPLQLALSAARGGAAAPNQPLLCRALWASRASLGPWLCPQGWEPWA